MELYILKIWLLIGIIFVFVISFNYLYERCFFFLLLKINFLFKVVFWLKIFGIRLNEVNFCFMNIFVNRLNYFKKLYLRKIYLFIKYKDIRCFVLL